MATDDVSNSAPKPGKGSGTKILLIFASLAGIGMLLCCGGFALVGWKMKDAFTDDPVKVRAKTAEIVDIEIPDVMEPKLAGNMLVMQMVAYSVKGTEDSSMLFLIQIPKHMVSGQQDAREQMEKQLEQQHAKQSGRRRPRGSTPVSRETRTFKIRGEDVPFQFLKYDVEGSKSVEVTGLFESKGGYCMLQLDADEENLSQEQIEEMLQSIK